MACIHPLVQLTVGSVVVHEDESGMLTSEQISGSAEDARNRIRAYFDDLRDTINKQEEAGLAVVNNYVREKLCSLRQQQEDIAVFMSQVAFISKYLQPMTVMTSLIFSNFIILLNTFNATNANLAKKITCIWLPHDN